MPYESVKHTGTKVFEGFHCNLDQLCQLVHGPVWDGNTISPSIVKTFVQIGLAVKCEGFTLLTPKGLKILLALGYVKAP